MPAENLVVFLPEAALHLQPHLGARAIRRGLHRRHGFRRQVDVEALQNRQRQARHAVVGLDLRHRPALHVLVRDLHAFVRLVDRHDLGAEGDLVAELALKAFRELIHAADRLEHRRHARTFDDGPDAIAEARLQQRLEVVRVARSASGGLLVRVIGGIEVAFADEEGDEPLLVLGGQRPIELILIDGLRHQLAGVADHVGLDFPEPDALAGQRPDRFSLVVEVRRLVLVDEHLQRHAELFAVTQHAVMPVPAGATVRRCGRDPRRNYRPASRRPGPLRYASRRAAASSSRRRRDRALRECARCSRVCPARTRRSGRTRPLQESRP